MKSIDEIKYKLKKDLDISIKKHEATIEDINGYRESVRSGNVINFNEYIKNHYYRDQNIQIISSISKVSKITGDLSGLDFSGTIFQGVNLSECNLQNTKFCNSDFQNVIIEKSQLNNTDFSGSNLVNTNAISSNFQNSKMVNTRLENVELKECDLQKTEIRDSDFKDVKVKNSLANSLDLRGSDVSQINLTNSNKYIEQHANEQDKQKLNQLRSNNKVIEAEQIALDSELKSVVQSHNYKKTVNALLQKKDKKIVNYLTKLINDEIITDYNKSPEANIASYCSKKYSNNAQEIDNLKSSLESRSLMSGIKLSSAESLTKQYSSDQKRYIDNTKMNELSSQKDELNKILNILNEIPNKCSHKTINELSDPQTKSKSAKNFRKDHPLTADKVRKLAIDPTKTISKLKEIYDAELKMLGHSLDYENIYNYSLDKIQNAKYDPTYVVGTDGKNIKNKEYLKLKKEDIQKYLLEIKSNPRLSLNAFAAQKYQKNDNKKEYITDLDGMNLSGTIFENADLRGVNFSESKLNNCQFTNCKIDRANFESSEMKNAIIKIALQRILSSSMAIFLGRKLSEVIFLKHSCHIL